MENEAMIEITPENAAAIMDAWANVTAALIELGNKIAALDPAVRAMNEAIALLSGEGDGSMGDGRISANPADIEVGDFIRIRVWKTAGQVSTVEQAHHGPDGSRRVLLQEHPDQPADKMKWFHLEPGDDIEFED